MAAKKIQEQIAEMENRCAKLEELQKLFEKAVKNEFGIEAKKIHKIPENDNENSSDFERKIASYFGLKSSEDFSNFLSIFCTENSLNYYNKNRAENSGLDTE